ncbi:MAG: pentapeptide repeat-containing protein [Deltaproteobacteria bacterium]|nr:pentapeptide repeat-containing protein [Deltaproteobacteria bacterium]
MERASPRIERLALRRAEHERPVRRGARGRRGAPPAESPCRSRRTSSPGKAEGRGDLGRVSQDRDPRERLPGRLGERPRRAEHSREGVQRAGGSRRCALSLAAFFAARRAFLCARERSEDARGEAHPSPRRDAGVRARRRRRRRGSVLRGSVLRGSVLRGSVLRGSVLRGSVLRGSVLRERRGRRRRRAVVGPCEVGLGRRPDDTHGRFEHHGASIRARLRPTASVRTPPRLGGAAFFEAVLGR